MSPCHTIHPSLSNIPINQVYFNAHPDVPYLKVLLDGLNQSSLGHCTDDGIHLLPALENHHCWDAPDACMGDMM